MIQKIYSKTFFTSIANICHDVKTFEVDGMVLKKG